MSFLKTAAALMLSLCAAAALAAGPGKMQRHAPAKPEAKPLETPTPGTTRRR